MFHQAHWLGSPASRMCVLLTLFMYNTMLRALVCCQIIVSPFFASRRQLPPDQLRRSARLKAKAELQKEQASSAASSSLSCNSSCAGRKGSAEKVEAEETETVSQEAKGSKRQRSISSSKVCSSPAKRRRRGRKVDQQVSSNSETPTASSSVATAVGGAGSTRRRTRSQQVVAEIEDHRPSDTPSGSKTPPAPTLPPPSSPPGKGKGKGKGRRKVTNSSSTRSPGVIEHKKGGRRDKGKGKEASSRSVQSSPAAVCIMVLSTYAQTGFIKIAHNLLLTQPTSLCRSIYWSVIKGSTHSTMASRE